MHLVGIGFTPEYWEELVHSIRKQSPDETLVGTLLSTEAMYNPSARSERGGRGGSRKALLPDPAADVDGWCE